LPSRRLARLGATPDCHHGLLGFTIIELTVVMSIIMILATLGLVQYRRSVIYAKEAVLKENLVRLRDAIDQHYADKNEYPSSLDALVSGGYIRAVPRDPFTESESTWQTVLSEPDPRNPSAVAGVYDVKSGSEAASLDGGRYADW
jgi:general secretion pathway protein G